ncbi:MAG: ABC transporter permease [Acidobacteriaceae bacterium]|nr:ABC transporter permease [Acidobacteriaceae bacterium]MBV9404280.1 ABC transporter permease [Acidobacteriaceae bacterium]MBV9755027.1 ABC transporter permease [Hyphomicrobiales bacterium]
MRPGAIKVFRTRLSIGALLGFTIVGINLAAVILAPVIAPYGQADLVGDVWAPPSAQFWLGLDSLGRDMLSRLLYGARTTVSIALLITVCSFAIGIMTGFTAAVIGRWVDIALSQLVDAVMAIPTLIFALVILSVLGTSVPALVGTIAVLDSTRVFRLCRAIGLNIVVMDYVEVARLRGEKLWWIMSREVLPNSLPPLITEFGLRFCFAFLFIAALSFVGLGIQPPIADWGGMVRDNAPAINFGGLAPLIPAAAIAQLTIGVNLLVDWYLSIHSRPHGLAA